MLPRFACLALLAIFCLVQGSVIYPAGTKIDSIPFNSYAKLVDGNTYSVMRLQINPCFEEIPDLNGSIPLVTYSGCEYNQFFQRLIDADPGVILFTTGGVRQAGWFTNSQDAINSIEYPIIDISGYNARLIDSNSTITIELTENEFETFFKSPGAIILNIIMGGLAVASLGLAIHKFIIYCRFRPFTAKSLSHINLLVLIVFLVLVICWLVDPLYARRYYNFLESEMFMTIATPLLMNSCCFIALFWLQVVNRVMVTSAWKGKYYYLCIILSVGISVLTVILGILKSLRLIEVFGVQLVIFIFFIGVAIIYIVAGSRLVSSLRRSNNTKSSKVNSYRRVAIGFILCSLSCVGYIAAGLGTLIGSFSPRPPYASVVPTMFVNFFAILLAFFQIVFLKIPTSGKSSSVDSNKRTQSMSLSKRNSVAQIAKTEIAAERL
jgi:hypothetical protein